MKRYMLLAVILSFLVDFLLLVGTDRLCGHPRNIKRLLFAAGTGGVHAVLCLLPGFRFLGNLLWRGVFALLMVWIAYGFSMRVAKPAVVFLLMRMAVRGISVGVGDRDLLMLVLSSTVVMLICKSGIMKKPGSGSYVPVELTYKEKALQFTALQDTGNMLRDPLTGQPVLVVDADIANEILGLTHEQLSSPVETVTAGFLPGLRLLPYQTINSAGSLLLALKMNHVKIGQWCGPSLVAFAPVAFGGSGEYQALTGGCV